MKTQKFVIAALLGGTTKAVSYGLPDWDTYTSIKEAADGTGLKMGSVIEEELYTDSDYLNTVTYMFDSITPMEMCASPEVAIDDENFFFGACKSVQNFAKDNGMHWRGNNMIWASEDSSTSPSFMWDSDDDEWKAEWIAKYFKLYSQQIGDYMSELEILKDYISDDDSDAEAFVKTGTPYSDIEDMFCDVFTYGKKFFPRTKLFYSDYDISTDQGSDYQVTKAEKAFDAIRGSKACGIDGVSFQMNIDLDWSTENLEGFRDMIQAYEGIGLEVQVSEFSVSMPWDDSTSDYESSSWDDSMLDLQTDLYTNVLTICLEEPNCTGFSFASVSDADSTLDSPANAAMIDEDGVPKDAFYAVITALEDFDRTADGAVERMEDVEEKSEQDVKGGEIWVDHDVLNIPLNSLDLADIQTVNRSKQTVMTTINNYQIQQVKTVTKTVISD